MNLLVSMAISIGFVSGIWMVIAHLLGVSGVTALVVPAWAAFIGMPLYFASGGGKVGLGKTMAANTAGAIMSILMVLMANSLSFLSNPWAIALAVGFGSFVVVMYSKWLPLSYIPGGFAGCASAFGFGVGTSLSLLIALVIALYGGAILGYIADVWGKAMAKQSTPAL